MDAFIRGISVFLEVVILAAIVYYMLNGMRLILADFGVGPKYTKAIVMILAAAGGLLVIFFIAHLTTFYPPL